MSKAVTKKKSSYPDQSDVAFQYYEQLRTMLRDLERIDSLIPKETSRFSTSKMDGEAAAIIQSRKDQLLSYIQIICRDHCYWGARLLHGGWTPEMRKKAGKFKGDATGREWIRENTIG